MIVSMSGEPLTVTPRLQAVLDRAAETQRERGQDFVGVEHVMIAILEDPRAVPTQVLATFVEPSRVRDAVREVTGGTTGPQDASTR